MKRTLPVKTSLRKHTSSHAPGSASIQGESTLSGISRHAANVAQVGVLALGVFGYFYTVLPVFQNQRLSEQNAKFELDNQAAQKQLDTLRDLESAARTSLLEVKTSLDAANASLRSAQARLATERERGRQLTAEAASARERETNAKAAAESAEQSVRNELSSLDKARWELVLLHVGLSTVFQFYNVETGKVANTRGPEYVRLFKEEWLSAFDIVTRAIDKAAKGEETRLLPQSYFQELRRIAGGAQDSLRCELPDFSAIDAKFEADWRAIEPSMDSATNDYIESERKRVSAEGKRLVVDDATRLSIRRSLRLSKEFEVDRANKQQLVDARKLCQDKALGFIISVRKTKGLL